MNQPLKGESNIGEGSGLLFSVYSKAAEDEDNKMVERWQKDADGILIFTGLFSAAVAALLAVTVLDLRPSSQDVSAFYLANIYQVLADPNTTRTPTPSPVTSPPSFFPPRNAVWVNSLWFLSLIMSLSCALWAISLQQWARRYLRRAQPARCSPEKRARMRAFFAEGVDKMHIPLAVEGLPMLLHLSLFLFFGGVAIFLFNLNREVFGCVFWWISLFSLVYGLITLLPIIRHDSPYHSPLSTPAWFLYACINYVTFKFLAFITYSRFWSYQTWRSCEDSRDRYQLWFSGGVEKAAEETASGRSSEIDVQILGWTISALGDDASLKSFFETIPRSFNSTTLNHLKTDIPFTLRQEILMALRGFYERTLTSNSISDSEKLCRFDISYNAINQLSQTDTNRMLWFLSYRRVDVPQTVEMGHTIARWFSNKAISVYAQGIIGSILVNVRERNDSWVALAAQLFGLPEHELRNNIALGGDNVLLAILIHVIRQSRCFNHDSNLESLLKLDIHNTLPRLQHAFCASWNKILQKARNREYSGSVYILKQIRLLYVDLHQGTEAAPTGFDASTHQDENILFNPSSYPFCNLASHHPNSITHVSLPLPTQPSNPSDVSSSSTERGNTVPQQAEPASNVVEPHSSTPAPTSEISVTPHRHDIVGIPPTNPVDFSSRPAGISPMIAVVAAPQLPQDIAPTVTLSRRLDGSKQRDSALVVSGAQSETSQILSTSSTNTPTPMPTRIPTPPLDTLSERYEAGYAPISADPSQASHFAPPSIGSFVPASHSTDSGTLPRLRARGLVNTKNICFANSVLQLLLNSPPFGNLFRELADLKGQRGTAALETGGSTTPLVDATMRFFKEYMAEEQSQPETGGTLRADEEKKDKSVVDSFEPTYLYDAMREKRQLKPLLNGQQQDAEEFLSLYLAALGDELSALLAPGVGSRGFESPITRIFGGRFRLPIRSPRQPDPVPTEDWRSLHLDIQSDSVLTIQDALMRVSQSQLTQDGSSGFSNASQQMLIEALPPILVLHLKRFRYDAVTGGIIKISKPVQFSSELGFPSEIMVPDAQRPSEPPRYKLYGVLYHHGESPENGHYTVDILHPNGDGDAGEVSVHIDDETVTQVGHKDVFREHGERVADERCAYLLFYCRTSPIGTS